MYVTDQRVILLILGTLSLIALAGGIILDLDSAFTIAATGIGAFAGAVNNLWGGRPDSKPEDE